ncbi:EAL domain-containing protein [Hankyongella ginsenosidimutans]|uniref:EAL domain-containing protein n=1 Tax=Hankyongella ginsenosidimutans TaxID=1763828 RepID=A0A4D7C106_9SPHN|nr:EAL domain-containing protein [Hankyongella ginsenosidimutans]QCI79394.1 EAL domain-containing protein [Hankyongella ginsenosidimutans]
MICGVEALCRWRHPHLGLVPPDEFVQHAEQTGAITELTRWTFEAALRELARWSVGGFDLSLAVNLSARMLHDESIPQLLASIARSYNLDPPRIIIEITESAIVLDPLTARKMPIILPMPVSNWRSTITDGLLILVCAAIAADPRAEDRSQLRAGYAGEPRVRRHRPLHGRSRA